MVLVPKFRLPSVGGTNWSVRLYIRTNGRLEVLWSKAHVGWAQSFRLMDLA